MLSSYTMILIAPYSPNFNFTWHFRCGYQLLISHHSHHNAKAQNRAKEQFNQSCRSHSPEVWRQTNPGLQGAENPDQNSEGLEEDFHGFWQLERRSRGQQQRCGQTHPSQEGTKDRDLVAAIINAAGVPTKYWVMFGIFQYWSLMYVYSF